jgi:hypothetical protein
MKMKYHKPKQLQLFRFVACFMSECCAKPHLWAQAVHGETYEEAKQKFIREVSEDGNREVFEIIEVTNGMGEVEEVES